MADTFEYVLPKDKHVVYQITFPGCSHKRYIGSGIAGTSGRDRQHIKTLRRGKHHNSHLQNAYNKYGEEAIRFEVVEVVKVVYSDKLLRKGDPRIL